jgi:hypothetical protein
VVARRFRGLIIGSINKEAEIMRNKAFLPLMVAMSLLATGCDEQEDSGGDNTTTFVLDLTGEAEKPTPGDPDGTGTATITLNEDNNQVCFDIEVDDIEPVTMAHIHEADVNNPGPIVVDFQATANNLDGCVQSTTAQVQEILDNPAGFYVNVHNDPFQAGALRAQMNS